MNQKSIWRNYGPEIQEAFEKIREMQIEAGIELKMETLEISEDGAILLDPDNPEHRAWFEDDAYDDLESNLLDENKND